MHDPFQDFSEVFFALCKGVNTSYSLAIWLRWKHRCFLDAPAPIASSYDNAYDFGRDYLIYSWASKARFKLDDRDLSQIAFESFIADEEFNRRTNERLECGRLRGFPPRVEAVMFMAQRKIFSVLGPFNVRKVVDCCRFGNGASNTLSRRRARFDKKITTLPFTVSAAALPLAKACIESDFAWLRSFLPECDGPTSLLSSCFSVTDWNTFDTVPKSLKTDRTIAKEPVLNGFLQQGVHLYMRRCLKRVGIDLQDQSINQGLAHYAQKLGLATIDLKSASNSVTSKLIELLLPPDWYDFLDLIRSRKTLLPDGTVHKNHMFSSMGNAFTFELETLIFWALTSSVCEGSPLVSVYGDDIICPQLYADDVVTILEAFGFRINREKSFLSGRFFESCGKHYFDGTDVTPVYQKAVPRVSNIERFRAHNRLIRWAARSGAGVCLDSTVYATCQLLARGVDRKHFGPIGPERDDFLQVPYGRYRISSGNAVVRVLSPTKIERRTRQAGSYAYWLRLKAQPLKPEKAEARIRASSHDSAGHSWARSLRRDAIKYREECGDPWLELSSFAEDSEDFRDMNEKCRIPLTEVLVELDWV